MIRQPQLQAEAICQLDAGECILLTSLREVPRDSYFGSPTSLAFLRYRRQREVR